MTRPRKELVCINNTPFYHITSRCVRRTFLCGFDKHSGRNYEHRRQWIVNRIRLLSSIFTIDICAYAVMSNHYHLTLKLNPEEAKNWSTDEVIQRWLNIYKGPKIVQRYQAGESLTNEENITLKNTVREWRRRLTALDWFMKCLNEPIARAANKEDQCTGHFWQARYKSQSLPTTEAVLSCMAYVDLNPVRAGIADTPETSNYTSIRERIAPKFDLSIAVAEQVSQGALNVFSCKLKPLLPLSTSTTDSALHCIDIELIHYLELLDWTGRSIRKDKRGYISEYNLPILKRLSIKQESWLLNTSSFELRHPKIFVTQNRKPARTDVQQSQHSTARFAT